MNGRGFAAVGLARISRVLTGHVRSGAAPGLVALLARGGEVHVEAIGARSRGGPPIARDAIFRIASMTKPVTAVAAMILVEECLHKAGRSGRRPAPRARPAPPAAGSPRRPRGHGPGAGFDRAARPAALHARARPHPALGRRADHEGVPGARHPDGPAPARPHARAERVDAAPRRATARLSARRTLALRPRH